MSSSLLTVGMVEEIQQVAETGGPVLPFVCALESATLPGLLEYGCARWHDKLLPPLPAAITESPLGLSLQEVRSELGFRSSGNQKRPPSSMDAHDHEFFALEDENSTVKQVWKEFLIRVRQSAKHIGFSIEKAKGIAASLGEMADNAAIHSNSPVGVLIGYQAIDGAITCCVVDVGVGVLASLRTNDNYRNLTTHKEAIRKALETGVTRFSDGGGLGFYRVFKSLAAMWGTLRFRSGEGCVTMDGNDFEADQGSDNFVLNRAGFQVTISCRISEAKSTNPLI